MIKLDCDEKSLPELPNIYDEKVSHSMLILKCLQAYFDIRNDLRDKRRVYNFYMNVPLFDSMRKEVALMMSRNKLSFTDKYKKIIFITKYGFRVRITKSTITTDSLHIFLIQKGVYNEPTRVND